MTKSQQATWESLFPDIIPPEITEVDTKHEEVENVSEPLTRYLITEKTRNATFAPISPVLKWAGGKSQLLTQIASLFPPSFENYHEPFLGGGAVFFYLAPQKCKPSWLCDINAELINFYRVIRDQVDSFIARICDFDKRYRAANKTEKEKLFYQIRNLDRIPDFDATSPFLRAMRFYTLNKTAYNGLHRTNRKGQFNVPWGRYEKPSLCARIQLLDASEVLQRFSIWLETSSFEVVLENAKTADFVYFDPPYVPLSTTASFTAYTPEGFNAKDQSKLADICRELDRHNVQFMLSNSDTSLAHQLYAKFNITKLQARRSINSNGNKRGPITELLITNY